MPIDPFTRVFEGFSAVAPRLCTDALEEQELLPTILREVQHLCADQVDGERIDREGKLCADLLAEVACRGWSAGHVKS